MDGMIIMIDFLGGRRGLPNLFEIHNSTIIVFDLHVDVRRFI